MRIPAFRLSGREGHKVDNGLTDRASGDVVDGKMTDGEKQLPLIDGGDLLDEGDAGAAQSMPGQADVCAHFHVLTLTGQRDDGYNGADAVRLVAGHDQHGPDPALHMPGVIQRQSGDPDVKITDWLTSGDRNDIAFIMIIVHAHTASFH